MTRKSQKWGDNLPKDTFFNLPEEKRQRIEEVAIQEFKDYSFDSSSINRIVENSEISKGSFYQYFHDKKDLYKHIMNIIIEKKLQYMSPVMMNPFNHDFFTLIREIYKSGLSFALENPDLLAIGNRLIADPNHEIYKEILNENKDKSHEVFELLLSNAIKRGDIRKNLDIKMISYLLTSINISIVDYYMEITNKREYSENMMEVIEKFIDFIQYGISKKGGSGVDD